MTRRRVASIATLLGGVGLLGACQDTQKVKVDVVLPLEAAAMATANVAAVRLRPEETTKKVAAIGTSFKVEIEASSPEEDHRVEVYLAAGTNVVGWGWTMLFVPADNSRPKALLGVPGTLNTLAPSPLPPLDPKIMVADVPLWGMVLHNPLDGQTGFFDTGSLQYNPRATLLPAGGLPDPADGILTTTYNNTVYRLAWNNGIRGWAYDPSDNSWNDLTFPTAGNFGPLPGAMPLTYLNGGRLDLIGGATSTSWVSFELQTPGLSVSLYPGNPTGLDAARNGATAAWLHGLNRHGSLRVVFGTPDPALPLALGLRDDAAPLSTAKLSGVSWTGATCVQLTVPEDTSIGYDLLCAGGLRNGAPTADAAIISWLASADSSGGNIGSINAVEVPGFFPVAPTEVHWLGDWFSNYWSGDSVSVYAQVEGAMYKVDRKTRAVTPVAVVPNRAKGGYDVPQANGATFIIGGTLADGQPNNTLQYFLPTVSWNVGL